MARPVLFRAGGGQAETAHHRTVQAVAALGRRRVGAVLTAPVRARAGSDHRPVELLGLRFDHRIGLAAGMDKNGEALLGWQRLGFGHVELGTVTPLGQPGNPTPRVFRLPHSGGVINRMGFNNDGVVPLADRLRAARASGELTIPVGVSIGKRKVTPLEEAVEDYLDCARQVHGLADYLAVNVSSPNTPNLRALQDAGPLTELLTALVSLTRDLTDGATPTPVLLKVAPDLSDAALEEAVGVATDTGVAGLIATNTTLDRAGVDARDAAIAQETGGLSGAPLTLRAREVVTRIRSASDLPIIGVGGVMTGADAAALVDAGADLVQLYSGLIYAGPALLRSAVRHTR